MNNDTTTTSATFTVTDGMYTETFGTLNEAIADAEICARDENFSGVVRITSDGRSLGTLEHKDDGAIIGYGVLDSICITERDDA